MKGYVQFMVNVDALTTTLPCLSTSIFHSLGRPRNLVNVFRLFLSAFSAMLCEIELMAAIRVVASSLMSPKRLDLHDFCLV